MMLNIINYILYKEYIIFYECLQLLIVIIFINDILIFFNVNMSCQLKPIFAMRHEIISLFIIHSKDKLFCRNNLNCRGYDKNAMNNFKVQSNGPFQR